MKSRMSWFLSMTVLVLTVGACGKETKKDAPAAAAMAADEGAQKADEGAKAADEGAKAADEGAKAADAHDPASADHVPCGAHGAGVPSTGERFPSVFKALPAAGTKISCPIKGETFEFSASRPTHEYNGKIYVFGCNGCKNLFLKDPEAALKKYTFIEAP
jgi:YHS domain-containing protein